MGRCCLSYQLAPMCGMRSVCVCVSDGVQGNRLEFQGHVAYAVAQASCSSLSAIAGSSGLSVVMHRGCWWLSMVGNATRAHAFSLGMGGVVSSRDGVYVCTSTGVAHVVELLHVLCAAAWAAQQVHDCRYIHACAHSDMSPMLRGCSYDVCCAASSTALECSPMHSHRRLHATLLEHAQASPRSQLQC